MINKKSKIIFVLNTLGLTGGVKVVFEQANLLANKGHEVHLVHLLKVKPGALPTFLAMLKKIKYIFKGNRGIKWFKLSPKISIHRISNLKHLKLSHNDIIVATANETADYVNSLRHNPDNKYYYVQDYEKWTRDKHLVDRSYLYPLKKIAISKNVAENIEKELGQKFITIIPPGIDLSFFKCEQKKIDAKVKILMLYHPLAKKGFAKGLRAIENIKKIHTNIEFIAFGAYRKPATNAIDRYYYKPSKEVLRDLYCESNIYLYTALEEGFGLTLLEAAASRCAIVTTKVGWTQEYGRDNQNLLFVDKTNIESITNTLKDLIGDEDKLISLGQEAEKIAQNFTWEESNNKLEALLLN